MTGKESVDWSIVRFSSVGGGPSVDGRFSGVRFSSVDGRFSSMDGRFSGVEFSSVDGRFLSIRLSLLDFLGGRAEASGRFSSTDCWSSDVSMCTSSNSSVAVPWTAGETHEYWQLTP